MTLVEDTSNSTANMDSARSVALANDRGRIGVRGARTAKQEHENARQPWKGAWNGKIVSKPSQIFYMRYLFMLIGIGMILAGLNPNFPPSPKQ